MNSLHPSFAFATIRCSQHGPSSFVCTSGSITGTGATESDARANLNSKLVKKPAPTIQKHIHHHIHKPHSVTINGNTFAKAPKPAPVTTAPKPKPKPKPKPATTPKPVQTQFLKDALATGKKLSTAPPQTVTTGTAPTATGQNPIKQALNKNQHKVITTSSPSSPIVNNTPSTTTTTTTTTAPQDTSTTDTPSQDTTTDSTSTPSSDPGNQTNVLLIGGAIFVGLMVLLLIV